MEPQVYARARRARPQATAASASRETQPLVQRATDHDALDTAAERRDRAHVLDAPDPARDQDRHGRVLGERPDAVQVRALEPADPSDLREQVPADLDPGQPHEEVPERQLDVRAPRPDDGAVRLDPDDEPLAEPPHELLGLVAVGERGRPEHDALGAPAGAARRPAPRTHAAARLHGHAELAHGAEGRRSRPRPSAPGRRRPRAGAWRPPRRTRSRRPPGRRRTPRPAPSPDAMMRTRRPPATSRAGMTSNGMVRGYPVGVGTPEGCGTTTTPSRSRARCEPPRSRAARGAPRAGRRPARRGRCRRRTDARPADEWNRTCTGVEPLCAPSSSLSVPITLLVQLCAVTSITNSPAGGFGRPPSPEVGLRDLDGAQLQLLAAPPPVGAALHQQDRVVFEQLLQALVLPGEHDHRDAAGQVLEPELRVRLALLRVPARHRGHDPRDRDQVAVAQPLGLGDLHVGERREPVLHPEQRVVGHELPEHLLLQAQEGPLVELVGRDHALVDLVRGLFPTAEQRELPGGLGLALGRDRDRDLVLVLDEPAPAVPERVERTRVDQALEHLLRQDRGLHLAAVVGVPGERALGPRAPR